MDREDDVQWFRSFVSHARWRFAKTYVESYPHEYTLQSWHSDDSFSRAIRCIDRWGALERFWTAERKYLTVEDRQYWHMAESLESTESWPNLINRSWLVLANYRDEARKLGYDEKTLDGLVLRWNRLISNARKPSHNEE
jgi:hypothetical protein